MFFLGFVVVRGGVFGGRWCVVTAFLGGVGVDDNGGMFDVEDGSSMIDVGYCVCALVVEVEGWKVGLIILCLLLEDLRTKASASLSTLPFLSSPHELKTSQP